MTDRELKKRLKKLGMILGIFAFVIVILSVYTLSSTKAELSIYDHSEYTNNLQAFGINEEEMKKYLSVFSNLESKDDLTQNLNMATDFIDEMCSGYEVQKNENGGKIYDADLVSKVVSELNGQSIKETSNKNYTYDKEKNSYVQNVEKQEIPYCMGIEKIEKKEEQIEITYEMAYLSQEQMAKYQAGEKIETTKKTIKAVVMKNSEYEYAKYFLSEIKE